MHENKGNNKGKNNNAISQKELNDHIAEIEELRAKQEQDYIEVSKLKDQINELNIRNNILINEKLNIEKSNKNQLYRINELENELIDVRKQSKSVVLQSQEFNNATKSTIKETKRLYEENAILMDEVSVFMCL